MAWGLGSGGPSPAATKTAATQASMAAQESRTSVPSAAYGNAWTTARPTPTPRPAPTAAKPPRAKASSKSARLAKGATPAASPKATGGAGVGTAGPRCAPGSIVLSLFTSEPSYSPGQHAHFEIYAVSTSPSGCEMPFGPQSTRVVVTHAGQVVWDSAACTESGHAAGQAGAVSFTDGVPQEVTLSWDRAASTQGCAGSLTRGETGTFDAVAMADGIASKVHTFKLQS
jgi:hypothetical protein